MIIINRYILKQLIVGFTVVLSGMTILVWLTQSLKMLDLIVTKGASVGIFLRMTLLVLPNFIQILSPLSLFAVTLFVFSRMQSDKELMVMKAVGMSHAQLMRAPLFLAFILALLGYFLTLFLIPKSNADLRELKWQVRNDLSHLLLQEGQFNSFKNGLTLYVKERLGDGSIKGVIAYDAKDPEKLSMLVAQKGTVFQEEGGVQVVFQEGTRQEYNPKNRQFSVLKFDSYTMWFNDKAEESRHNSSDAREHSMSFLIAAQPQDAPNQASYRKYKVEAFKRIIQPLYNFTFVFLALFGVLSGSYNRRGQLGRINFVVGAALIVQSLSLAFENMSGKNLWFMPLMGLNVILPVCFVYLFLFGHSFFGKRFLKKASICLIFCLMSYPCWAFNTPKGISFDADKPVDFEADTLTYDNQNDIITATGDVVIEQNGTVFKMPKLVFERKQNKIYTPGPVTIILPDQTVTTTQELTLSADMKEAVGDVIVTRLYDGTYMTADTLKRSHGGQRLTLGDVTYTPCDVCEGEDPLWQIRSKKLVHNAEDKTYTFKHSFFDLEGIPVFYFPYFQIPDHTVKRKTGFLTPSLSHGSTMKGGVVLPFFVDVADNQNFLLNPTLSSTHFPLIEAEYQGLFQTSGLNVNMSATKDNDGAKQGHIDANMTIDLSPQWRLSGRLFKTSTDTYFRRYNISHVDDTLSFLSSYAAAERFGTRNYFNMTGYSFQSLQDGVLSESIPVILPVLNYRFQTLPLTSNGLYAFSEINSALVNTRQHFKSNRLSLTEGVHLPYISPFGAVFDFIGTVRADGYSVDTGTYGITGKQPNQSYMTGRIFPSASLEVNYPLAQTSSGGITQVLEPIIMGIVSPNGSNSDKIPNVDSLMYDFDDTNLFSRNRFAGYDRVESGSRLNYGIKWSLYSLKNRSISVLFGQSYRFSVHDDLSNLIGYDERFSDYVGRFIINYETLSLSYRYRLDQDNLVPNKHEFGLWTGTNPLRVGIDYIYVRKTQQSGTVYPSQEEIVLKGVSQFSKNWSLAGSYRYNLSRNGGPVEFNITTRYDNECLAFLFDVGRSYTRDRNYKGDTSFTFKVIFKTLGGTQ